MSTPEQVIEPAVYTVGEAARLLRKGRNSIYELVASGELHAVKLGKSIRIPRRSIDRLLEGKDGDAS